MSTVVLLSIGVGIVLVLPIGWRVRRRRFDPFEPIVIFALAWGVMFVVRPIAIVVRDDTNFYGVDIGQTLDKAVLLGLVGAVAFVVGYEIRAGRSVARWVPEPPEIVAPLRVLMGAAVVAALGTLALALVLLPSGLDGVDTFLNGRSTELSQLIDGSTLYLWYGSLIVIPAALVGLRDRRDDAYDRNGCGGRRADRTRPPPHRPDGQPHLLARADRWGRRLRLPSSTTSTGSRIAPRRCRRCPGGVVCRARNPNLRDEE